MLDEVIEKEPSHGKAARVSVPLYCTSPFATFFALPHLFVPTISMDGLCILACAIGPQLHGFHPLSRRPPHVRSTADYLPENIRFRRLGVRVQFFNFRQIR